MALHNVKIKLELENQIIEGTFRGILQASSTDVLLLGNKKSSLLLLFSDTKILSITINHTDSLTSFGHKESYKSISTILLNKEKILTETYEPLNKQEAYSILTGIYSKYKGSKTTINTEDFDNIAAELQYNIKEDSNMVIPFEIDKDTDTYCARTNYVSANQYIRQNQAVSEPKITKDGMSDFMSKILEGHSYKRNYREAGYSGQLTS